MLHYFRHLKQLCNSSSLSVWTSCAQNWTLLSGVTQRKCKFVTALGVFSSTLLFRSGTGPWKIHYQWAKDIETTTAEPLIYWILLVNLIHFIFIYTYIFPDKLYIKGSLSVICRSNNCVSDITFVHLKYYLITHLCVGSNSKE